MAITNHERVGKAMELLKGGSRRSSSASSRARTRIAGGQRQVASWVKTAC